MPRLPLPYAVYDVSALARALRAGLEKLGRLPSHVELLNLLARGAGYGNYQHFRAGQPAGSAAADKAAPAADLSRVERAARHFDPEGRLLRWPARANLQELCLWVLWSRIPAGVVFTEQEISALLGLWNGFGDHALLRRALYDFRLVDRTRDGREYRRIEQAPPPELQPLLKRVRSAAAA